MNSTLYGETEQHNQTVYYECFFFPILGTKTPKCKKKNHPISRNIISLPKTRFMRVFELDRQQNTKVRTKYSIWKKKNESFEFYQVLTYQNAETHGKRTIGRNIITLLKMCFGCFPSSYQNENACNAPCLE